MDADDFSDEELTLTFMRYFEEVDRESSPVETVESVEDAIPNDRLNDSASAEEKAETLGAVQQAAWLQNFIFDFNQVDENHM